jgi:hypothetical protein
MSKIIKCKDCALWKKEEKVCSVVVLLEGVKHEIKTEANDPCVWIKMGLEDEIQSIRTWSDGKDGYIETTEE